VTDARRGELAASLAAVTERIQIAAGKASRDPEDVTLVVVTKTWPPSDLRLLYDLGVRDIGENRHQEAEDKAGELSDLDITWHFVGQVQSNKAPRIAGYADVVHSVDSVRVAHRLNAGAHTHERTLDCFVQASLDPADDRQRRGGVPPDDVDDVAAAIDSAGRLRLVGVMGIAPLGGDPTPAYQLLADVRRRLLETYPHATGMSAGMSSDFEAAIAAGATHVRVGSAVLGERPPLR
jgi:PLP dependent protein